MCRSKDEDGLGFKKFEKLNQALVSKLVWWMLSRKNYFCVKQLAAKYKVRADWLKAPKASNASWVWKGIERVKNIIKLGLCKLVGSRNSILVWEDPWLPNKSGFIPIPRPQVINSCLVVSQF